MDSIYRNMLDIFDEYNVSYDTIGCDKIYNTWLKAKEPLINILSKHPNWNPEKKYIAFDTNWTREPNEYEIRRFFDYVFKKLGHEKSRPIYFLCDYYEQCISQSTAEVLNDAFPELKAREGQKTSKVVRKVLLSLGFSEKDEEFRQRYANYSDAINPLKIKRHTVVSVNLIDYLLSSNGNSWSSCHTLDKDNPNGYSGAHCSGTLSYALDKTTIVFYQVDEEYDGNDLELEPKIIRQMFHYNDGNLVQGRLYPQCNDGKNSLYVPTREIMQRIIAECTEEPNLWIRRKGTEACKEFCATYGTNYPDYIYNNECSISRLYSKKFQRIIIGRDPICPVCGTSHENQNQLTCSDCGSEYRCAECGEPLDEDDVYWVNGQSYCFDCVRYCEHCEDYELSENVRFYEELGMWICDDCIEEDFEQCYECGEYFDEGSSVIDAHGNTYCPKCAAEKLTYLDGEYYPDEEVKQCKICGRLFVGDGDCCKDCEKECKVDEE